MATFANLVVKVRAKTAGAAQAIRAFEKKASSGIVRLRDRVKALSTQFATVLVAAIAAATFAINRFSQSIDKLAKTARLLGLTVESLQKLRYFAELEGIDANTFDLGLQRFVRRLGEAANGTGEAVKALEALKISAEDLEGLTVEQKLIKIGTAIKQAGDRGTQLALAFKFFDSEAAKILRIFDNDVASLSKRFEELGVTITTSQAKAVESFEDAKTRAKSLFSGLGQAITSFVAPAFSRVLNQVSDLIQNLGLVKVIGNAVGLVLSAAANTIAGALSVINGALSIIIGGLDRLRNAFSDSFGFIAKFTQTINNSLILLQKTIITTLEKLARFIGQTELADNLKKAAQAFTAELEKGRKKLDILKGADRNLDPKVNQGAKTLAEKVKEGVKSGLKEGAEESTKTISSMTIPLDSKISELTNSQLEKYIEAIEAEKSKLNLTLDYSKGREGLTRLDKEQSKLADLNQKEAEAKARLNRSTDNVVTAFEETAEIVRRTNQAYNETLSQIINSQVTSQIDPLYKDDPAIKLIQAMRQDRQTNLENRANSPALVPAGTLNNLNLGNGLTSSQTPARIDINISANTDLFAAEIVNSSGFKQGAVNLMQEAARNDKR